MLEYLAANASNVELVSSWGVNDWYLNAQRNIPGYLLSTPNGTAGGLLGTYYADTDFKEGVFQQQETPNRDWGLYPPNGLPSNNFSVIWEGMLTVPVDGDVDGWIGVALSANTTARLYIDDALVQYTELTTTGNIQSNIPGIAFTEVNSTLAPAGGAPFKFVKGNVHKIRLEYQAYNLYQKLENVQSVNAEIELFWNLVDRNNSIQKVRVPTVPSLNQSNSNIGPRNRIHRRHHRARRGRKLGFRRRRRRSRHALPIAQPNPARRRHLRAQQTRHHGSARRAPLRNPRILRSRLRSSQRIFPRPVRRSGYLGRTIRAL